MSIASPCNLNNENFVLDNSSKISAWITWKDHTRKLRRVFKWLNKKSFVIYIMEHGLQMKHSRAWRRILESLEATWMQCQL